MENAGAEENRGSSTMSRPFLSMHMLLEEQTCLLLVVQYPHISISIDVTLHLGTSLTDLGVQRLELLRLHLQKHISFTIPFIRLVSGLQA